MNAEKLDDLFPADLTKRVLSQGSPRLWMGHYLRLVGTKEDLDQMVWEVCLDPKHRERLAKKQWLSLGGFVAAKMRAEIRRVSRETAVGDSCFQEFTVSPEPEDLFLDPFQEYFEPGMQDLVRDRFYAGTDRAEQTRLLSKYGLSSTSALRMRALRAVNEARRKHSSSDS